MDDFERELQERLNALELSPSAEEARRAAVGRAMAQRVRRRRNRRRGAAILVALALAAAAAALAIALSDREEGRTVPEGPPGAREGRAESPYLQGLPWLWQPNGNRVVTDVRGRAVGLAFPPDVAYRDAVSSLYMSVSQSGTLPRSARVVSAPADGVVLETRGDGSYVVALAAPWGYDPITGVTRLPRLRYPRGVSPAEALAIQSRLSRGPLGRTLPQGVTLESPRLPACQVRGPASHASACPFMRRAGVR